MDSATQNGAFLWGFPSTNATVGWFGAELQVDALQYLKVLKLINGIVITTMIEI